jgi:cytochrome P450
MFVAVVRETPVSAKLSIQDYDEIDYDPFTASARLAGTSKVTTQFYPEIDKLRAQGPVLEVDLREHFGIAPDVTLLGRRKVTVFGYPEGAEVLTNTEVWSNSLYELNLALSFGRGVTVMDPPEHRPYRMLFQRAFLPNMIAHWGETLVPRIINGLIDRFEKAGKADLAADFALHFPFHFINELLQLPPEHRPTFQKLAFGQTTMRFDPDHAKEAARKLRAYLKELVAERRARPLGETDFISAMADAEVEGEKLDEEMVISFLRQLMNAGGDTTYHGFSNVLTALLTRPEALEEIRGDRALVVPAIEEGLRLEPPLSMIDRTPNVEVELGGVVVRPGDHLTVCTGSAHRDERVFENGDAFDLRRKGPRPLTFGFGPHVCIGQHLARLEMRTALNALLDRLPNLRLDPGAPPPVVEGGQIRGAKHVNVLFG